jgi:predicted Zn-dependent protease
MKSLIDTPNTMNDDLRFLSSSLCEDILNRIFSFVEHKYRVIAQITSSWEGSIRWARNRTSLASNRRLIEIHINVGHQGYQNALVTTNQLDDESLEAAVRAAIRILEMRGGGRIIQDLSLQSPKFTPPEVRIWSEATYKTSNETRAEIARLLAESAENKELLSTGYIEMRAGQIATKYRLHDGQVQARYDRYTNAECSLTVRHPKGIGSGWAGASSYDWAAIDGTALAKRALDKCIASINPVRIEPGRYTVILEPQAVCQLVSLIFDHRIIMRLNPEGHNEHPFRLGYDSALGLGRSKLGLKIVDERITIRHNPLDPNLGVIPISHNVSASLSEVPFTPVLPVTWIDRGVLKTLNYDRRYGLKWLNENLPAEWRPGFYMDGGDSSIDEMIETTKRGLLVTRFSNVSVLDWGSLLCTGVTRDGLWLIENGAITKAVHNFRFSESPVFMLNQVELIGKSVSVYNGRESSHLASFTSGPSPVFVPALKVRDFSFTSLVDAV